MNIRGRWISLAPNLLLLTLLSNDRTWPVISMLEALLRMLKLYAKRRTYIVGSCLGRSVLGQNIPFS